MPRNGSGVYSLPAGSLVTDNVDDILASQHNTPLTDLQTDMNTVRPIVAGGTGASSASGARTALGLGTLATQNEGTAAGEFRDNAANEALFAPLSVSFAVATQFKIMNGCFDVSQIGFSGVSSSGGTATRIVDRWYGSSVTGSGSSTFTLVNTLAAVGHLWPQKWLNISPTSQSFASDNCFIRQRLESARTYAGQTITIFGYGSQANNRDIAISVRQNFGTGGSPSSEVVTHMGKASLVNLPTPSTAFRVVCAIPSILGKTFGTNGDDYLEIRIWASAGSNFNSETGSLGLDNTATALYGIHERVGDAPIASIAYYQPPDPQAELARCMRYYLNLQGTANCGVVGNALATGHRGRIPFPVRMRAVPAESFTYSGGSGAVWTIGEAGCAQTTNHSVIANITSATFDAEL